MAKATPKKKITVLERRLQNPFGDGSPAIELKEPGFTLRVVNGSVRPGRYHDVTRNKGWEPVLPGEILGDVKDFGFDEKDGRIVRGERGQEVLVKMPTAWFEQIAKKKDELNRGQLKGSRVKRDTVDAVAKSYGDQAAEFVEDTITMKATRSPVPLDDAE